MSDANNSQSPSSSGKLPLKKLTAEQVEQIDQMLESIGDDGEVHVVVQRGQVKYINRVKSHKVRKNEEGNST